jgi:hypothetical protein
MEDAVKQREPSFAISHSEAVPPLWLTQMEPEALETQQSLVVRLDTEILRLRQS